MSVSVGAASDVGLVRAGNEDAYLVDEPLFVVADGMGGHVAGDVASSTAIEAIEQRRAEADASDPQTLARLVHAANAAVWSRAGDDPSLRGMGTTLTLAYVDGPRAHIAHVGDSRAYRLRNGRLEQLTDDHTLVARMVKEGKLAAEDAERHPHRSIITRSLGVGEDVSVDLVAIDLDDGDRLVLCSDGLPSMVDSSDIEAVLGEQADPQRAAEALVELANAAGGEDNVTVLVVDFHADGAGAASASGPPPPPARADTDRSVTGEGRSRGRWLRRLVPLVVLAALVAGGFAAARYALDHSWFVGVDGSQRVAIFSGIPEEFAGLDLRDKLSATDIDLEDIPEFARGDVSRGIKVSSLDEAQQKVRDLNNLVRQFRPSEDQPSSKDGG
jgi:serine/threonine protein phosphatase PrpC